MTEILIRRDEQIKPCVLSGGEELSIEKLGPTALPRSFNIMRCEPALKRERHAFWSKRIRIGRQRGYVQRAEERQAPAQA